MEPVSKNEFTLAMTSIDKRFDSMEKDIHGLATMVARGFEELTRRLDVKERVDVLEKKMKKVETALNVQL